MRALSLPGFAFVALLGVLALLALRASAEPQAVMSAGLVWDAVAKHHDPKPGEVAARFEFTVTNRSAEVVAITALTTSCGCTVAQLPPLPHAPLQLNPGAAVTLTVTLDLPAKMGEITKTITVETSRGPQSLRVSARVPATPESIAAAQRDPAPELSGSRANNTFAALENPQVIFKGDCASCHVTPGIGKHGRELYVADCAICHDAEHRASLVPDLKQAAGPRDAAFWRTWITEGKPGTMMPPFAATRGGPLTSTQVDSLVAYLLEAFPGKPAVADSAKP